MRRTARPAPWPAPRTPSISASRRTEVTLEVGAIIVATGYDPFDARRKPEFGYGRYPGVRLGAGVRAAGGEPTARPAGAS